MIPSRFGRKNQKESATSRHCRFYRQTGLAVFRRQPVRECRPASRRNRRPNPKETAKEEKNKFCHPNPARAGCPPRTVKKHPCQTRQIYFHVRFQLRNLKTPDENPPKNCLCRYRTKSANRGCLQQIRLFHGPIFHGSIKIHITLTGFPVCFSFSDGLYMQRPSESLIFRHRDETEWGRESCLNHRHRNQLSVPFRSISICATARNVRPKLYPGRRGGFRRAGGIRPRPR